MIDSATESRGRATAQSSLAALAPKASVLVWAVPCLIAAVYLIDWGVHFSSEITSIGWISDYAFAFVAPRELVTSGMGGHMNLGTYGSYAPLWFGMLTAKLPYHRELWKLAPMAVFVTSLLMIGWSVAQIAGRLVGGFAVMLGAATSPPTRGTFLAPAAHNAAYLCTALLGAYLVWLTKIDRRSRGVAIAVPCLVAVAVGVSVASDSLLVLTGVAPFALTSAIACLRHERRTRRVALSALATVAAALPIAWLTSTIMSALGYGTERQPIWLAPLSLISHHVYLLSVGLKQVFNGYLGVLVPGPLQLSIACDVIALLCLAVLLFALGRSLLRMVRPGREAEGTPERVQLPIDLHIVYWVLSGLMVCGGFLLSSYPLDSEHLPFYLTTVFSVAAVIPLFVRSRPFGRWLIPIGTSIFFVASIVGLKYQVVPQGTMIMNYESAVLRVAEANHATIGYASYESSTSLTWNSDEHLLVRPVYSCPGEEEQSLCRSPHDTMESWYEPGRRRTFLLIDPITEATNSVLALPKSLGRPIASYRLGAVQMFIYPYDIASRIRHLLVKAGERPSATA